MKRRLAISLSALLGLILLSGSAFAWETRVLTLGDQNRWVQDDANIWLYPQRVLRYGDRLYLDLARRAGEGDGRVVDAEGEREGLEALKDVNGGFILDMGEAVHMAFWASSYTDATTRDYLRGASVAQARPAGCGDSVGEPPGSGSNPCGFMADQGDLADHYRSATGLGPFTQGANRKLDVFAGFKLAPAFDLGAHLWYGAGSANSYDESSINKNSDRNEKGGSESRALDFSTNNFGLGLGATIGLFADSDLDIGLRYSHYAYSMTRNDVAQPVVDGGNSLSFDTRMNARLSKHWFLVPALQFNYTGFTGIVETGMGDGNGLDRNSTTIDWTSVNFDLGLGMHMVVAEKAKLYTAVGIDYDQDKYNSVSNYGPSHVITTTTLQLPYWRTGFEAPLFSWMELRAGFIKRWGTWQRVDDYLDGGATNRSAQDGGYYRRREVRLTDEKASLDNAHGQTGLRDFETFVGATFHHADWFLTTELDPNFIFHGPVNTMDPGTAGGDKPWFARVELSYRF